MEYLGFHLDPFQEKACHAIDEGRSCLVAAPTGCGKTVIAEYAVEECLKLKQKVVYTAPIKALSNQKFRDFRHRFGPEIVGIHTGDVTLNPEAPLLIMTTEIFRNLILERSARLDAVRYVVFDEIHYLDDPERGTVWEECIILAPKNIQFICLSATVPNVRELAAWMEQVREYPIEVIEEFHRPVPLRHYLYHPRFGIMNIKAIARMYKKSPAERKRYLRLKPSSMKIVNYVLQRKQFPVLYFCFNRRACERNAEMYASYDLLNDKEYDDIKKLIEELVTQYGLAGYERVAELRQLWVSGVAFHHAGLLPAAKEIVERLFTTGLIKLLFCTETFALGINMPANTVIIDELEKFNGVEFKYLMTRQYNQIAGRAGRRGMDTEGFVYSQIIPEASDPRELERILNGKDERINSRFIASYSTILNLYTHFGEGAFELFRRSLSNFRQNEFLLTKAYQREEAQIRCRINFLQAAGFLKDYALTEKGKLAAAVSGYEIQTAELYYSRSFDDLTARQIPVVLAALITEESRSRRGRDAGPVRMKFEAEKVIFNLRKKETAHGINTPIREKDLSLAMPVYAWSGGCTLNELTSFSVPEGDLVRILRMTVQLLKTLRERLPDPVMSDRMHEALLLVNRDVVDAQAELEIG